MRCLPQSGAIASLCAVVLLVASGCGTSKIAQCNQIIDIANTLEEVRVGADDDKADKTQTMLQIADALEQANQNMQALELSDTTLQKFQLGFITMYSDTSNVMRTFAEARDKGDISAVKTARADLQRTAQLEEELVNGINGYCRGSNP
ncbi:MAG: hypothetical protein AB4290_29085 [Spirulina sp.]